VVLLSEGIVADPRRVDLAKVTAEAQAARVSIYILQLEVPVFEAAQDRISPTLVRDLQVRGDGLARIAGAARGAVFRLAGDDPRPFERIAREMSGYYLLAFEPTDAERDGRAHRIRVRLPPGPYTLRVAAIDPVGRQGSVERPFDARVVVAEGVRVSDLILAPPPARPDDRLEPSIDRLTGSTAVAYLELHPQEHGRLPDAVRIVMTRGEIASAMVTVAADIVAQDGGWAIARAVVPTTQLPPGRYVAHAEVIANGRTIARVARPFTIARGSP
jgi:hypothetical protein